MTKRTTWLVRATLVAITLVSLSSTLVALPAAAPRTGAWRWAQSLGEVERSFYLQDSVLRSVPAEYRSALLASLPKGAARADFWRGAFGRFRDGHELSTDQVTALNRAIARTTPEAMDGTLRSSEAVRAINADLAAALGSSHYNDLFLRAVDDNRPSQLPILESLAYEWRRFRTSALNSAGVSSRLPFCNCMDVADCGPSELWECKDVACIVDDMSEACGGAPCVLYCVPKTK